MSDGAKIRLKGKGAPGENGGPPGDLFIVVHVGADPVFGRSGDNVTVKVPVTFTEAALGADIAGAAAAGRPGDGQDPRGHGQRPHLPRAWSRGRAARRHERRPARQRRGRRCRADCRPRRAAALLAFREAAAEADPRAALLGVKPVGAGGET